MVARADHVPERGGLAPAFAAVRARLALVALLLALAGLGWWWTAREMQGMDEGPWTGLGTFGWFLAVWVVMMAAMMFPSVAPTVALYSRMTRRRSFSLPLLFAAGYLLTWVVAGAAAFAIGVSVDSLSGDLLSWDRGGRWIAGATLLVAAAYELTPLKDVCLAKCHSPLGFLLGSWRDGFGRCAADGGEERRVVRRLLLGADGRPLRVGDHEHHVDGGHSRTDRAREDGPMAPGRGPRDGRAADVPRRVDAHRPVRDPGSHDPFARPDDVDVAGLRLDRPGQRAVVVDDPPRPVRGQSDHETPEESPGLERAVAIDAERRAGGAMEQAPAQPVEAACVAEDRWFSKLEHRTAGGC